LPIAAGLCYHADTMRRRNDNAPALGRPGPLARFRRSSGLIAGLAKTWFRRPDAPTRLVMDVTRRCNLRCRMCSTWKTDPGHELAPDEVRRVLAQMPGLLWLDVTGGEPFLRRDVAALFQAVTASTPALRVLHFQTNGWFRERTREVLDDIVARRPDLDVIVTVSIDGPPDTHDAVRGRAGSFERALATFRELRVRRDCATYVGTTVTPFNADRVEALGALLRREIDDFRDAEWHWNWLQVSGHFFANADLAVLPKVESPDLVRHHLRRRGWPRNLVELMELVFLTNLEFYRRGEPSGIVCQALRSAAFVSPEGDLYPCHVYDRPLGNVLERPVEELWRSAPVLEARRDVEALACGGCFTPCEAYPALAGAPWQTLRMTASRAIRMVAEGPAARVAVPRRCGATAE
jgi:MoaA/NifB/PqqE/SkfB family radical SAM enzyme